MIARLPRGEVIDSNEVAILHVINRAVRRCFLLGEPATFPWPTNRANLHHSALGCVNIALIGLCPLAFPTTDWSFVSGYSPPHIATTQLPLTTGR